MDKTIDNLKNDFISLYGGDTTKIQVYFAPGRVNLLGEHTDYNGGLVMPFSLQYGTLLLARKQINPNIKFKSTNFKQTAEVCLKSEIHKVGDLWINYPLGVIKEFIKKGLKPGGMELLYYGNIPNGAGLSSSASIEMVTAFAVSDLYHFGVDVLEMVNMAQRAENLFVGMNCGIMDMFAIGMGKENRVIQLDCDTLEYDLVEVPMGDYRFVISNTNKVRRLADSKYNERRAQCEKVVEILQPAKAIRNLSQLTIVNWDELKNLVKDEVLKKRANHIVTENQRVRDGREAFQKGDLGLFGKLMIGSHQSLKDDYEVSCYELDVLVDEALKIKGVLGSRMTGAGFGGCTISLVHQDAVDLFQRKVGMNYKSLTGLEPEFYLSVPADGVRKLN